MVRRRLSRLDLPVVANKPYRIAIRVSVPKQAASPEAGLYLDGKRIAPILYGKSTIEAELPAAASGHIALELRCHGWVPKELLPGSNDDRVLGINLYRVTMRAAEAGEREFSANAGRWGASSP